MEVSPGNPQTNRTVACIASLVALFFLAITFFLATHLSRNLDSGERKHVDGATQFINGFVTLNGRIPDNSEFEHWTDSAERGRLSVQRKRLSPAQKLHD